MGVVYGESRFVIGFRGGEDGFWRRVTGDSEAIKAGLGLSLRGCGTLGMLSLLAVKKGRGAK